MVFFFSRDSCSVVTITQPLSQTLPHTHTLEFLHTLHTFLYPCEESHKQNQHMARTCWIELFPHRWHLRSKQGGRAGLKHCVICVRAVFNVVMRSNVLIDTALNSEDALQPHNLAFTKKVVECEKGTHTRKKNIRQIYTKRDVDQQRTTQVKSKDSIFFIACANILLTSVATLFSQCCRRGYC